MQHRTRRSALVLALLVAAWLVTPSAQAGVVVVAPGGAPGAPLLQAALDAAQPGDILLLHAGDYSGSIPHVSGKGLVLTAAAGEVVVLPGLQLNDIPVGPTTVLRGLRVEEAALPLAPGHLPFEISAHSAPLWLEDCVAIGSSAPTGLLLFPALSLVGGESCIVRCQFFGARGADAGLGPDGQMKPSDPGGDGLQALAGSQLAHLVLHDSLAVGGRGGDGPGGTGFAQSNGGVGANISFLAGTSIQGGTFLGGDEGDGNQPQTKSGSGLALGFCGYSNVRDFQAQAGAVNGVGVVSPPMLTTLTILITYPAAARLLSVSSPVRELESAAVHVQAVPGDSAWLIASLSTSTLLLDSKQGVYLLGSPLNAALLPLGTLTDPSGTLDSALPMPRLPPGVDGIVLFTQLGVISAQGQALLGTGSAVVWLSAAL